MDWRTKTRIRKEICEMKSKKDSANPFNELMPIPNKITRIPDITCGFMSCLFF